MHFNRYLDPIFLKLSDQNIERLFFLILQDVTLYNKFNTHLYLLPYTYYFQKLHSVNIYRDIRLWSAKHKAGKLQTQRCLDYFSSEVVFYFIITIMFFRHRSNPITLISNFIVCRRVD